MTIAAILPHLLHNGGVRRFIELGNAFIENGHPFIIYVPKGFRSDWSWDFKGEVREISGFIRADVVITGDTSDLKSLKALDMAKAGQKYIYVIVGGSYHPIYRQFYKKYPFILNNRVFLKHYQEKCYLVEGGVSNFWKREKKIKVGFQARKDFGITEALSGLDNLELVPFRNLNDKELMKAYHSVDFVVVWENREGWCNTAIEALRCGKPVVTNGVNCEPFIDKCIVVKDLKKFFEPISDSFLYRENAIKLLKIFKQNDNSIHDILQSPENDKKTLDGVAENA